MKYLKTYEENINTDIIFNRPWSRIKIKRINKLKDELTSEENKLLPLLTRYLLLNQDLIPKNVGKVKEVISYRFFENTINITYYDDQYNTFNSKLKSDKVKDFFDVFLKNPEAYKNAKKYNL